MKIQASFEYIPGQYFEFLGDDDVWVFINNRLVVDIGGQHPQAFGSVNHTSSMVLMNK
jgi:fibro-slime domain-containing protein